LYVGWQVDEIHDNFYFKELESLKERFLDEGYGSIFVEEKDFSSYVAGC
tara:strand:+ start:1683 stop:1829 length:147 start_codon:yes stop_codon:yes gene_type:complete